MPEIAGFPNVEVRFNKDAGLVDASEVARLLDLVPAERISDLLVFCHGWNNDMNDARALNLDFFTRVRNILTGGQVAGLGARRFAIVTVLWPSKKFADSEVIPGGAASLTAREELHVQEQLEDLKAVFQTPSASAALDRAKVLVPQLDSGPSLQNEFVSLLRSLVSKPRSTTQDAGNADAADAFFSLPGAEVLERLKSPVLPAAPPPQTGVDSGGAAGIGEFFGNLADRAVTMADTFVNRTTAAASNVVNLTTYYQMKERAGDIGANGLDPVLRQIRAQAPAIKIHLIGHSFGGRLVTACTDGTQGQTPLRPNSLTLLQAAFSHNGFARLFDGAHDGFFRNVVTEQKVSGPIVISCSIKDRAVGLAYPLASRLAGQQAAALGDANDLYGGIGRNGAQHTPEAVEGQLLAVGGAYAFQPGSLYNLHADAIIGGHSEICKDEVAYALLSAIAAS